MKISEMAECSSMSGSDYYALVKNAAQNMKSSLSSMANWIVGTYQHSSLGTSSKTIAGALNEINDWKGRLNGLQHPVGSFWMTSTNTNPSAQFGGTWELVDKVTDNNLNLYYPACVMPNYSDIIETQTTVYNFTNKTISSNPVIQEANEHFEWRKIEVSTGNSSCSGTLTFSPDHLWSYSGPFQMSANSSKILAIYPFTRGLNEDGSSKQKIVSGNGSFTMTFTRYRPYTPDTFFIDSEGHADLSYFTRYYWRRIA